MCANINLIGLTYHCVHLQCKIGQIIIACSFRTSPLLMDWTLPVQDNKRFMIALCHGTCAWVLFFSYLCPLAWIHRRIRVARSVTYASSRNKRNFFIIRARSSSCLHTLIAQLLNWQDHLPSCPNTG